MIAAWVVTGNRLDPLVLGKRVHVNDPEGMTAVAPDQEGFVLENYKGVAFPRLRLPPLDCSLIDLELVDDVFGLDVGHCLLDDLPYLGVRGGQVLLLVVIDVQQLLIANRLLDVVIEL